MTTNYPSSLDTFTNPTAGQARDSSWVNEVLLISSMTDAIEALQGKVWVDGSTNPSSLDYRLSNVFPTTTKWDIIVHNGSSNVRLGAGTNWHMLVASSSSPSGLAYVPPSSGGTVTSVSVGSANWFAGIVTNPTTTPNITISTPHSGMLKGNWSGIVPATAWVDYVAPWVDSTFRYISTSSGSYSGLWDKLLYSTTVPAGTLGTSKMIEWKVYCSFTTWSSGDSTSMRIYYWNQMVLACNCQNNSEGLDNSTAIFDFCISGNGTTSSQVVVGSVSWLAPISWLTQSFGSGTGTVNSAVAQSLEFKSSASWSGNTVATYGIYLTAR